MLEKAGLVDFFSGVVTAEDGCETAEQTYLVSCLKIKRPPSRCVVFEDDPKGVVAAHDAMTKAVAVIGKQPGHAIHLPISGACPHHPQGTPSSDAY